MLLFLIYVVVGAIIGAILTGGSANRRILGAICCGLMIGFLGWKLIPTIGVDFGFIYLTLILCGGIAALVSSENNRKIPIVVGASSFMLPVLIGFLTTSSFFHADKYSKMAGEHIISEFDAETVSPVDITQLRVVDQDVARRLGEKRLGEKAGLGSMVTLGRMNIQKINGSFTIVDINDKEKKMDFNNDLYWVAPLIHSGVFKQIGNDYTPGYIMVSATDTSKSYLVTGLVNHNKEGVTASSRMGKASVKNAGVEKLKMRYLVEGGYFGSYVPRMLKTDGYMFKGLVDYTFEIDDNGRPYWVITEYEKTIGFNGKQAVGIVLVDVQNGNHESYSINDAPEWIDRIQPESYILSQLDYQGEYVHGWWNPSNRDKTSTTPGASMVVGADGRLYLYTGIQSVGSDTSTTAFVLVDVRTKDIYRYNIAGANESAAEGALSNAPGVKEAQYSPSSPIVYNVAGEPAYFATLKGSDGVPKMYGFVSLRDYTIIGVANNKKDALRRYQKAMRKQGTALFDDLVESKSLTGIVKMTTKESIDGTLYYYFIIEGVDGKEFIAPTDMSLEVKWTKEGSNITVTYDEGEQINSINLTSFDNNELSL